MSFFQAEFGYGGPKCGVDPEAAPGSSETLWDTMEVFSAAMVSVPNTSAYVWPDGSFYWYFEFDGSEDDLRVFLEENMPEGMVLFRVWAQKDEVLDFKFHTTEEGKQVNPTLSEHIRRGHEHYLLRAAQEKAESPQQREV